MTTQGYANGHDLNSTGKCNTCKQQVGYELNLSNYSQYIDLIFETEKNSSGKDVRFKMTVQPIKNVQFCNVVIGCKYSLSVSLNSKYSSINGQTGVYDIYRGTYYHKCSFPDTYSISLSSSGYGYAEYAPELTGTSNYTLLTQNILDKGVYSISGYIIE